MSQPFSPVTGPAPTEFDPFAPNFTGAAEPAISGAPNNPFSTPPAPPQRRGIWGWWLRLTSPHPTEAELRNALKREEVRRGRVLSGLLLMMLIVVAILAPNGVIPASDPGTLGGTGFLTVMILVCAIFNRRGNVTTAGVLFVFAIAGAVAIVIFGTPAGLGLQDMPDFDLFAAPVVLAGVLLPRIFSVITWFVVSTFTTLFVLFAPLQPNLQRYIATDTVYVAISRPIILAGFLAVISWIAAGSVQRAIFQEDKSAEVERAYTALSTQKRQLDEAIAVIQNVHSRVANGDMTARAPIMGGELVPLTVSLNLMLERLNRLQIAENTLGSLEMSVQNLSQVLNELAQGRIAQPVPAPGNFGRLAPIALNLEQLRSGFVQVARNSRGMTDRINAATQEVVATSNALIGQLLQYATVDTQIGARDLQDRLLRADKDLTTQVEQLHNFLSRFSA